MRKILVDADALIALAFVDDGNNKKAESIARGLTDDFLCITQFTIIEVVTVLSKKVSHKLAKTYLEFLRQKNYEEFVIDERNKKMADEIFIAQNKKGISWIDCFNVAVYKLNNLDMIFSFDKFYKKMGIKTL